MAKVWARIAAWTDIVFLGGGDSAQVFESDWHCLLKGIDVDLVPKFGAQVEEAEDVARHVDVAVRMMVEVTVSSFVGRSVDASHA